MALGVVACGGGGGGSSSTGSVTPPVVQATNTAPPTVAPTTTINSITPTTPVTISGSITFDHVPFNTATSGLNFNAITQDPAPGVIVESVSSTGAIMQRSVTDANGAYSLSVEADTVLRIRVRAEMPEWDVRVIDNTSSGALYAFEGALVNTGTTNSIRNLNAPSGWGGSSYTSARVAGPFAILAPIFESIQRIVAVDPDVVFPFIDFNWSVNNNPSTEIDISNGDIGTSSYVTSSNGSRGIYILGSANNDTDEYDEHVVIHEWGHYFEDQLSRSDSIGGSHGLAERLDPRLALGEGFGNALSGMMTDDPFYRDSLGSAQSQGFFINVENNNNENEGWYNEGSTQSILYDIFDSDNDGPDQISAGLAPIYNALTSPTYIGSNFFTTIFLFLDEYNSNNPDDVQAVNALANAQSISGTGAAGIGETNNGTVSTALPLYNTATVNGGAIEICSVSTNGDTNNLGNRVYIIFDVLNPGSHTMTMSRISGTSNTDPDFFVFQGSEPFAFAQSGNNNSETASVNLTNTGQHLVDAFDFENGDACYSFTITR